MADEHDAAPDRLAAVLDELDAVRQRPDWVPSPESMQVGGRERRGPGRHRTGASGRPVIRPAEPLLRLPEGIRDAQVSPSRLAIVGAVALVLVAGLIFATRVLTARASAAPRPVAAAGTGAPPSTVSAVRTHAPSPTASPASVVVQVVGQVKHPGVVSLKSGARVQDAVTAAGGALPKADLARVNLARVVVDGEQIQVPAPGQPMTPPPAPPGEDLPAGQGVPAGTIDLNSASEQQLESLPGVGPVLASRIEEWRTQHGRFTSVDELTQVSGIGEKVLEQLRPHVRV